MADPKLVVDEEKKKSMGIALQAKRDQYKADRVPAEKQWMINLRQHRGVYDPEVAKLIPESRSKAYPRDTRIKVKAFVARMMEMMFPATDVNWELEISPIPSIAQADLALILQALEQQELMLAEQEQRPPNTLASEKIEAAVKAFAIARKDRMQAKIHDQLFDPGVDWPQIVKRVLRSGAIFGIGIVKAPLVRTQSERVWQMDKATGQYVAVTRKEKRPYPEFIKLWDVYPDLSALSWEEQEGLFERVVLTRQGFRDLIHRPGFDKAAIKQYLRDHTSGNYQAVEYESELSTLNKDANPTARRGARKYEVFRYFGFWSGHDLKALGVDIKDEQLDMEVLSDIWMVDDIILSADLAPFGEKVSDAYHAYLYAEDEDAGLTGTGLPEEVRDTQMGRCSAKRALYDNMATNAGPMYEVAVDLLKRGSDYKTVHAFKVFEREGDDATLQYPAVREISSQSHIPQLISILAADQEQMDIESNIPNWTLGATQPLGEAFRTSNNMSMMFGGANMVTKDHARSFDKFVSSVVTAFLNWNMEFGDPSIKGDFQVKGKGNISLVAKEVRGAALDQFVMTLTPEERQMLKTREILIERLKARDLPVDIVVSADEAARIREAAQAAQAAASEAAAAKDTAQTGKLQADTMKSQAEAQRISATVQAQVAEIMARVESLQTNSKVSVDKMQLANIQAMLEQVTASATEGGTSYGPQR